MAKRDTEVPSTPIRAALAHELSRAETTTSSAAHSAPQSRTPTPPIARPDRVRKALFTTAALRTSDEAAQRIGDAVGIDALSWSSVNRALWECLRRAIEECGDLEQRAPGLARAVNGDLAGMREMEQQLSEFLAEVLRSAAYD